MPPRVSVIIPVYNVEKYLRQCLDSVVNQTLKDIEIICVDDGSTDRSMEILREFEASDPRVTVVAQEHSNAGAARNRGLKIAQGEYLSFLDSDDFFEPQMLEKAYAAAIQNKADIAAYRCDFYYNDTGKFVPADWTLKMHRFPDHTPFAGVDILKNPFSAFVGWAWDKLFSARFVRENKLQFQEQRAINDLTFVYSSIVKAESIVVIDEILVHQRKNRTGALSLTEDKSWDCFYHALVALKKQMLDWGLFARFEQDYVNYALNFSLLHLKKYACLPQEKMLYDILKDSWFDEFEITKHEKSYFYSRAEYRAFRRIMDMDYEEWGQDKPVVSIIIPVYNAEAYLRECLDSVIGQTLEKIEIICVNDGSTDRSTEILREYEQKDSRIILVERRNQGYGASMNAGLVKAAGEYVGIVEADDFVDSAMFQRLYETAACYEQEPDIVKSAYMEYYGESGTVKAGKVNLKPPQNPFTVYQYPDALSGHPSTVTAIYRREFIKESHIQYIEAPGAGWTDNPFFWTTMCLAKSIVWVPESFYFYWQDNPEASSHLKDCTIPFKRLNEVFEFIERTGIEDAGILIRLYGQVLSYIRRAFYSTYYDREQVRPLIQDLVHRMKPELLEDDFFSKEKRRLYQQFMEDAPSLPEWEAAPKVSVIIPVYNVWRYLRNCLDSVVGQTLREIEIICIDDGSTDYSREILQEYRDRDPRVKILFQENAGEGKACNRGLSTAQGEYIAFMDADDYYPSPDTLEKLYRAAKEQQVAICGGNISRDQAGKIVHSKQGESYFKGAGMIEYRDVQYDYGYQQYIFSRRLLNDHDIIFADYLRVQVSPFFVKAMLAAERFYAIPDDTYCYRTGYQKIDWTAKRTNDLMRGLIDNLVLSEENGLDKLHRQCVEHVNRDYFEVIVDSIKSGNRDIVDLLKRFNDLIDTKMLGTQGSAPYRISPLKALRFIQK